MSKWEPGHWFILIIILSILASVTGITMRSCNENTKIRFGYHETITDENGEK